MQLIKKSALFALVLSSALICGQQVQAAKPSAAPAQETTLEVKAKLDAFAKSYVARANDTLKNNRQNMSVTKQGKGYVARYTEVDASTMTTEIYPGKGPGCEYVGHIVYLEKVYECTGKTISEAKTGTFRSATLFLGGGRAVVRNLTVQNNAGDGAKAGQALAVYADASRVLMENVNLYGNQDTLFTAPLPLQEREQNGFRGPRENAPRLDTTQYYRRCTIRGNIDFIFGGADALFEHCTLRTVDNGLAHSWVTAPSGAAGGLGFVFWDCDFVSDCPAGSVYLGRPWRPTGKTAVLDCRLGAHIAPEGFAGWNDRTDTALAGFAETGSTGAGAGERPGWVQALSAAEAAALLRTARQKCRMETTERITE